MSPSKPSTKKRPRGTGGVFQRCEAKRGCPDREPVEQEDGTTKLERPVHKCKGMWIARLDLGPGPDGQPRRPQRAATTKAAAERKLDEMQQQYARVGDVATKNVTVEQWLTRWLDEFVKPKKAPKTYRRYRTATTQSLIPALGRHRLDALRPEHLRALYKHMKEIGRAGSRPQAHAALRKALSDAMSEGLVMRNVAKLVPGPGGAGTERTALTTDEGRALLRHVVDDRLSSRWVMALLTGTRQGECLGLTWDRVDLDARIMDLAWQLQRLTFEHGCGERGDGAWPCGRRHGGRCPDRVLEIPDDYEHSPLDGGLCLVRPKSETSKRILPIPVPLYAALVAHQKNDHSPNPHNLVWHELNGRPIEPADDTAAWDRHLRGAGLPDVVLHEARHTTITLLMEAGVDPSVIKAIAGHSSLVVQETYKHADVRHMAEALGKVAGALYIEEVKGRRGRRKSLPQ